MSTSCPLCLGCQGSRALARHRWVHGEPRSRRSRLDRRSPRHGLDSHGRGPSTRGPERTKQRPPPQACHTPRRQPELNSRWRTTAARSSGTGAAQIDSPRIPRMAASTDSPPNRPTSEAEATCNADTRPPQRTRRGAGGPLPHTRHTGRERDPSPILRQERLGPYGFGEESELECNRWCHEAKGARRKPFRNAARHRLDMSGEGQPRLPLDGECPSLSSIARGFLFAYSRFWCQPPYPSLRDCGETRA